MHRKNLWNLVLLGAVAWLPSITSAQNAPKPEVGPPEVTGAVYHDVSPRLGDMASIPGSTSEHREVELKLIPRGQTVHQKDPVVQTTASAFVATTSGLNIAGVGNGDYGFTPNAAPPDTNGAVGATQYVQWVNESFAVFDKTTGAIAPGFPKSGNTLWSGFGGGCQTNNDGDPVVAYDKAANRWILTQFSVSTTPYLQCVAVSTTSDATGSYFRYAFSQPNFNDYPKLGVWPDGYYISFNMFNGNSFVGGRACAFDRTKMLTGAPATQVCFQLTSTYGGLLPSDLDGSAAPPAGSPNYFLSFGNDSASMDLWKFHVDFATPANSTFAHSNFAVPAFAAACGGGGTCIPQGGATTLLDSLADRLMHRLAYRNFGSHESLVVNHSVTAGSSVGVRWYEIRNPGGTPTVFQSSTYAPDSSYRWMGSIAMDKVGNIALGYSVSSSTLHPAVRYTGRAPGDPVGTLQAETSIIEGGGSQNGNNLSRWGDYSAMTIDPTDDCTFFYTNEYEKTTGSFNWSTRIASFKFPSCTTAQVLTSITVSPSSATVSVGRTKQFSATGLDQFGNPMTTQPTFTWAVNGGGTIDSSGLFSATTTGGPFTVTASSTGMNGMASVTVTTPLSVTGPTSLSSGTVGVAYGPVQFTASGGTGGNTWTSTGLPTGLTLSSTGSLSGTPGAGSQGSYNPQFTVQDSSNATASTTLSLTINAGVSGTISLISHASASAKGTATATSPAINTTGATLLVMMASDYSRDSTTDTHTDSKGNTWIPLTNCVIGLNNVTAWYTLNPITDPSHTFSVTGSYTSMAIEAYSGVTSFQSAACKISSGATLQAGPVTTTVPSLVLTFIDHAMPNPQATVSGGFTIIDYQAYQGFEGLSAAYQIQASAGTANPTWTNPNVGVNYSGFMVVFAGGGTPPPVSVSAVTLSPTSVIGGTSATANTVTLSAAAPAGGAVVTLSSSDPSATVPASVTVAAGATVSPSFTITTTAVATNTPVTITATYNGTKTATLTVLQPSVSALTLSPTSVVGGGSTTLNTVTLNGPAPSLGAVVTLSSSDPSATVPASVTVAAGGTVSPSFTITTTAVAVSTPVTITATYNGTKTAILTVTPAGASGPALISHASASAKGTATATSPAINTTGATLLVMMASDYSRDSTTDTHTDSKGNTWIPLTNCVAGLNNVTAWYTLNPITDPSHTFSVTGSYTSMAIEAYSGVTSFQSAACKISSGATLQAGPVTTTVPSLVLTFIDHAMPNPQATVSGGFTITDYQAYQGFEGLSAAYQIQTSAGTANPTWTNPNAGVNYSGFLAVFH